MEKVKAEAADDHNRLLLLWKTIVENKRHNQLSAHEGGRVTRGVEITIA
jgi:hypothetical protein